MYQAIYALVEYCLIDSRYIKYSLARDARLVYYLPLPYAPSDSRYIKVVTGSPILEIERVDYYLYPDSTLLLLSLPIPDTSTLLNIYSYV
jgi:hypothetical protein